MVSHDDDLAAYLKSERGHSVSGEPPASATSVVLPRPSEPRVLCVANQKGGVGKTTSAVNLAAALAQGGLSVLLIDVDPQGNASTALSVDHTSDTDNMYDLLVDGLSLEEIVQPCPKVERLLCAPAAVDLAGAEIELVSVEGRERRLRAALDEYLARRAEVGAPVDYVLIDCPPSFGLLTLNALVAAREVLIPIQCEYYALEGLSQLLHNIGLVQRSLNPELAVSTILLTMYDGRTNLSRQVADDVRAHFPQQVIEATIPRSVRISEAPSFGQTVLTYEPYGTGALSYIAAATEIAKRATPSKEHDRA